MYLTLTAAVTKYHKLGGFSNRNLTLLEARSLKSRCLHVWFLLEALRENLPHAPLPASGDANNPWSSLDCSCIPPTSASVTWLSSLCVSLSLHLPLPPLIKTPVTGLRAHPDPVEPHLSLHLQSSYFQIRSHPEVSGGREFGGGDTIQPNTKDRKLLLPKINHRLKAESGCH